MTTGARNAKAASMFNPLSPDGNYLLNLADPADRTIAAQLCQVLFLQGFAFKRFIFTARRQAGAWLADGARLVLSLQGLAVEQPTLDDALLLCFETLYDAIFALLCVSSATTKSGTAHWWAHSFLEPHSPKRTLVRKACHSPP
eukprot:364775-Chlamydomonas_euryale.AAC.11